MTTLAPHEVAAYYRTRMPRLQQNGKQWSGPCPIHDGKHKNFSVNAADGRWFCHSKCNRGGDIFALEMALTGVEFGAAADAVNAIVGRPQQPRASKAERRRDYQTRIIDEVDNRDATYFRLAAIPLAEHVLEDCDDLERFDFTQLIVDLKREPLEVYRDVRAREPLFVATLVLAGRDFERRTERRLASFIADQLAEVASSVA